MKGSMTGALIISVMCFMVALPIFLIFAEMWSYAAGPVTQGLNATDAAVVTNLGNSFFYHTGDQFITLLYFMLIFALFVSALYEAAHPETLPIGLVFLIPLMLITLPLSDMTHAFYTNPGFANVAPYFTSSEYLSDQAPQITTIVTLIYIIFVVTKKQLLAAVGFGQAGEGGNVVSG